MVSQHACVLPRLLTLTPTPAPTATLTLTLTLALTLTPTLTLTLALTLTLTLTLTLVTPLPFPVGYLWVISQCWEVSTLRHVSLVRVEGGVPPNLTCPWV